MAANGREPDMSALPKARTEPLRATFVVATKDRPGELRRLLRSLEAQTSPPAEVVVVDGSRDGLAASVEAACQDVQAFPARYVRGLPPSAARQRNLGLEAADPGASLIGFFDDDAVLDSRALEKMMRFWRTAEQTVGGAALVMENHPATEWPSLKLTAFAQAAGLYSRRPGTVAASGFQTMIGSPRATVFTDWLPSGASVWRREVFARFRFDEWFEGYSYLEDLDFSYRVGKAYRLAVVAGAGYRHYPAAPGRGSRYEFGVREVLNRVHFVRKHAELSLRKCWLALAIRLVMSLGSAVRQGDPGQLGRAWGNAVGLARAAVDGRSSS
jgi:GT2 family glycosyltransferase